MPPLIAALSLAARSCHASAALGRSRVIAAAAPPAWSGWVACSGLMLIAMLSSGPASACAEADGEPLAAESSEAEATAPRQAALRALQLLEAAAAGSADQRTCFTCHSQAMPVLAILQAEHAGLEIDRENLQRQIKHTADHLRRGREDYMQGRGQGGKADTAGYALWTLSAGRFQDPETTAPVVDWLMDQQQQSGRWKRSSDRPPSEASHFTTTYLALRAITSFAADNQRQRVDRQVDAARAWLVRATAKETEDRVFRLLALQLSEADADVITAAADDLLATQRDDGGWGQTDQLASDAYATGSALYALAQVDRLCGRDDAYLAGIDFLVDNQREDGSWHVASRSRPFQTYYETGFPHGPDQFISTSATAWAALAILLGHF